MTAELDPRVLRRLADMHAVYRMFDANDRLVYVGMTGNLGQRLTNHSEKRWFPLVTMITLEWFPHRAAALVAEQRAIQTERPGMNITGKRPRKPPKRREALPVRPVRCPEPAIPPGTPEVPAPYGPVTLREAVELGLLPSLAAARKASTRPGFPEPVGVRDLARRRARKRTARHQGGPPTPEKEG